MLDVETETLILVESTGSLVSGYLPRQLSFDNEPVEST